MYNTSKKIAYFMEKNGIIDKDEIDLYSYGFRQMFMILLNLITIIVVGLLFNKVKESILFSIFYIPIRSYSGGFHCENYLKCYIFSIFLIVFVLMGVENEYYLNNIKLIAVFSYFVVFIFAPVEDKNRPLSENEKKKYKNIAYKILGFYLLINIVVLISKNSDFNIINICIILAVFVQSLAMLLSKVILLYKK